MHNKNAAQTQLKIKIYFLVLEHLAELHFCKWTQFIWEHYTNELHWPRWQRVETVPDVIWVNWEAVIRSIKILFSSHLQRKTIIVQSVDVPYLWHDAGKAIKSESRISIERVSCCIFIIYALNCSTQGHLCKLQARIHIENIFQKSKSL